MAEINHLSIWENSFGNVQTAYDYAGRKVHKSAYNNRFSNYGWNIDHIRPISLGGTSKQCNLIVTHIATNDEKKNRFPHWKANEQRFKAVKKSKNCYDIFQY